MNFASIAVQQMPSSRPVCDTGVLLKYQLLAVLGRKRLGDRWAFKERIAGIRELKNGGAKRQRPRWGWRAARFVRMTPFAPYSDVRFHIHNTIIAKSMHSAWMVFR